jgi:hypothetical protein
MAEKHIQEKTLYVVCKSYIQLPLSYVVQLLGLEKNNERAFLAEFGLDIDERDQVLFRKKKGQAQ